MKNRFLLTSTALLIAGSLFAAGPVVIKNGKLASDLDANGFAITGAANFNGVVLALPIGTAQGGTGRTTIGTALQVLRVNAAGTALEYATLAGGGGGAGDFVGPGSSTDNAIVRFDGTTGKLGQASGITIADGATGTLSGTNTGDQTITLSGPVTGSGTGAITTSITDGTVVLADLANMATASVYYRKTAGTGAPEVQTLATLKTDLGLTGTNSGDQTTITGNAGSATILQTARNINGVSFNGSANITVPAAGSTLTDTVPTTKGGTGLTTLGTALQVIRVNSGATGLEFGTVSGGGGATIANTTDLIKGDNAGNGLASGIAPANVMTLSGTQTVTGNKTFTGAITMGTPIGINATAIVYDPTGSGLVATNVQAAIDETLASHANVSLAGNNAFTGQNSFTKAPIVGRTALAAGTALTIGTFYTDTLSANRTLTFTGSPVEGSSTGAMFTVTNSPVLSFPSAKRIGDLDTAISSIRMTNGVHTVTFVYLNAGWKVIDSVGVQNNDIATTDPVVGSDQTAGYGIRSQWLNTTTGALFVCTDASTGAAVWKKLTKRKSYLQFAAPHRVDGTGAVLQTSDTTATFFGQALFSNSAAKTANWIEYRAVVPEDLDTAVDLRARFKFQLSATDTGKHRYEISMADVANGELATKTLSNAVNADFAGDASGASADIEGTGWVTLTTWRTSLTAGDLLVIRVARVGDDSTNDTSTVNSYSAKLAVEYGVSQ